MIEVRTGLLIDFIAYSKSCIHCNKKKKQCGKNKAEFEEWQNIHIAEGKCYKNYFGNSSGSMEADAAIKLWSRSIKERDMRYMVLLSDGDTDTWTKLNLNKPYGENNFIVKEECINHIHKRLSARMNKLRQKKIIYQCVESTDKGKTSKGQKSKRTSQNKEQTIISRKSLKMGGAGRLTIDIIDHMSIYYAKAIREANTVEEMIDLIMMSFYLLTRNDLHPRHHLCLPGEDSFCFIKIYEARVDKA